MKTIILTLVLVVAGFTAAIAQTGKGRWTSGVSIGSLTYQDDRPAKRLTVNLTPSAGYFIKNNLLIGTGIPLSLSTYRSGSGNPYLMKSVTTGIGLSPFVRYYFGESALRPYLGLSYSYSYTHYKYEPLPAFGSNESGSGYSTSWAPTFGLAYFINRNIAVNAALNYVVSESKTVYFSPTQSGTSRIFDIKQDSKVLSLSIGVQVFFGN